MSNYKAPLRDSQFLLYEVFDAESFWSQIPHFADDLDRSTADAILEEGAKLATDVIEPLNRNSDEQGVSWNAGEVTTPDGFLQAYRLYSEGGWGGLGGDRNYGGMGMPKMLAAAFEEMIQSASMSFALYPMLTAGACLSLAEHASEEMKNTYLEKMYSGIWSGTMCLTESHAGSDLGIIKTKAIPNGDDSYCLSGTKIFITSGEHDLTENIIHLVLAKLPDSPKGPKGISLFVVPKFLVNTDGSVGERNQVSCGSIEHKMGIKGSSTCVINFDGASGFLVGEKNNGLNYMFTMMNYERLGMGIQGVGAAERSYQRAAQYAKERLQGRASDGAKTPELMADPIIVHPDVRRMLLTMRAFNEAGRCLSTYVAMQIDIGKYHIDADQRSTADQMIALLTPLTKAFVTDMAFDCCVMGQQIFGGHGYIREWGQEQLVRDVRISQIYEGTNGIQALDLLKRKIVGNSGVYFECFIAEINQFVAVNNSPQMREFIDPLKKSLTTLCKTTKHLIQQSGDNPNMVGAAATEYLALFGYVTYAYMWTKMAAKACNADKENDFYKSKLYLARFYMQKLLPRCEGLQTSIITDNNVVMAMPEDMF